MNNYELRTKNTQLKTNLKFVIRNSSFIILFALAIFAGVGFFGNAEKASAQDTTTKYCYDAKFFEQKGVTKAECNKTGDQWLTRAEAAKGLADSRQTDPTKKMCFDSKGFGTSDKTEEDCLKTSGNVWRTAGEQAQTGIAPAAKSEFENQLKLGCSNLITDFDGCTLQLLYWIFHDIPAWFLVQTAYFFNIMMSVSLDGKLFKQGFVSSGWGIVRDLSNIFFILVLLYVAIKIILGLAGHGVKETIAKVVVVALLINFSMFFTGIVIDTSNMLALVFYNKLKVTTTVNGQERPYASARGEKDVSGGMVAAFDPTRALSQEFFTEARKVFINGERAESLENHDLPFGTILAVIIISGLVMGFAIYALFVSAFAFVARLIELWLLIIASPFAFMSSTMHEMEGIKDWGWKAWLHRLITASFMAPAFMFFLYFIFLLIQSNIFKDIVGQPTPGTDDPAGIIKLLLGILMPMMLVLTLLLKAVKLAKSGAGQFGDTVMNGAKLLTGLAVGAASAGTALAGRATVGAFMKGASTGDTAANRIPSNLRRIADNRAIIADPHSNIADRTRARGEIARANMDLIKGRIQEAIRLNVAQNWVGERLNRDQHNVEHAAHARHDLDDAAGRIAHGKKWEQLNGEERYQVRRQIARDRVVRDNAGDAAIAPVTPGISRRFGNRKWADLTTAEREEVDRTALVGDDHGHAIAGLALDRHTTVADELINDARGKQGVISNVIQSTVGGTYDIRNLAEIIAKEQTTGFAKLASSLTGGLASGMRGGLKMAGVGFSKAEGKFFKDLGSTISESLKNIKVSVDLSHVGEVKKEDSHGGGHGGGHH